MTTAAPSAAIATIQPVFTDAERIALAGFLTGYRGLTREAYALDLRQFASWCRARSLGLFAVRRADIEGFARELEAMGRARATVTRRLSLIAGFYRYAVEEELLERSSAAHVRRPELGQLSAHLAAGGAIEGIAEGFIQNAQVPDLHLSAGFCHPDGAYPRGYRPVCDRKFSAHIRSSQAAKSQFSASRDRSGPERDPSQVSPDSWPGTAA
jgi:hypothetical protein